MFILITLRSKKYEKLLTIIYFVFFLLVYYLFLNFVYCFQNKKLPIFFVIKKDNLKQKETN